VKPIPEKGHFVPVLNDSPWNYYEKRYRAQYGSFYGIITFRKSFQQFMIRTISGHNSDEQKQNIRQLCHDNIVRNMKIYTCNNSSYYLISEFMPTSLLHLCRAPVYPNEPQLSSILYQVCAASDFRASELSFFFLDPPRSPVSSKL
jgi:hypothetical protein